MAKKKTKYKFVLTGFEDGSTLDSDELYDTYEEAEAEAQVWLEGYSTGAEVFKLMRREYGDPSNTSYYIEEV